MANQRRRVRPRTARRAAERAEWKMGDRAERRGRRVPPTIAGFETALLERGYDGVAEALISRHNQRMQRMAEICDVMQRISLPLLASYLPLSMAAEELGAEPARAPSHSGGTWPDHLMWGLDSVAAATRLILSLQPVGACVIARTQLERWSSNREFNSETKQKPGEDTATWLNRLWVTSGTRAVRVGDLFADLSELLHARGPLMPLVWLDVADIMDIPSSEHVKLLDSISDALVVSLYQLRTCLTTAAEERGWDVLARTIDAIRLVQPAESWLTDLRAFLWPMNPRFFHSFDGPLSTLASRYRRVVAALRAGRKDGAPFELWPILGFGNQRFRALTVAAWAFEKEREKLGDQFQEHGIEELATEAVLAGEMAAMLAIWLRDAPGRRSAADAFAVCASALRSAEWLWLEDDDRAMGVRRH